MQPGRRDNLTGVMAAASAPTEDRRKTYSALIALNSSGVAAETLTRAWTDFPPAGVYGNDWIRELHQDFQPYVRR